ncbi:hypothetical protein J437_LFUL006615, partial [Ladona fulva]
MLLCYGRASLAIAGDSSALAAFLDPKSSQEMGAIAWILQHLDSSKGLDVRLAALATIRQICCAILPQHSTSSTVDVRSPLSATSTQAMRQTVLTLIGAELPLLAPAIQTLNLLMKILPPMSSDERISMLRMCLDTVFPLTAEVSKEELGIHKTVVSRVRGGAASSGESDDERDGFVDEDDDIVEVEWSCNEKADDMNHLGSLEALNQLRNFVTSILTEKTCAGTLGEIFTLLEAWIARPGQRGEANIQFSGVQRMAAMLTLQSALSSYLKNFKLTFMVPSKFTECGWMAGVILPRCSDSFVPVRSIAVHCLRLLLSIVSRYDEGLPAEQVLEPDYEIKALSI